MESSMIAAFCTFEFISDCRNINKEINLQTCRDQITCNDAWGATQVRDFSLYSHSHSTTYSSPFSHSIKYSFTHLHPSHTPSDMSSQAFTHSLMHLPVTLFRSLTWPGNWLKSPIVLYLSRSLANISTDSLVLLVVWI